MPPENLEVVRRLYEAFNRRDYEKAAQYLHPEGEIYPALQGPDMPGGSRGHFIGRQELREFLAGLGEVWESVTIEPADMIEAPDGRVLAVERWHVRGRDGIEVDTTIIDVYTIRGGLMTRVDGYVDKAEAFEAVGLPLPS